MLTCRSKLHLIKEIRKKIRNTPREELFRNTCFGWLLDLDDSLENCVLIHFMSCRQVERLPEDTVAVPLTYHINGHFVDFGREEFCLITRLTFGPEFRDLYKVCPIPYKMYLFDYDIDSRNVSGQMLLNKIQGAEFDNMQDEDAVSVCQLAVLHFVLLGRQLAHNIPDWWLRLIVDKKRWEDYPWGSLVWAKLYEQLENANEVRAEKLYAAERRSSNRPAQYTLSGFTFAFKTWILETFNVGALQYYVHEQRYPRAVAWSNFLAFKRKYLPKFFNGAIPNRRLIPDAYEAKSKWWVRSLVKLANNLSYELQMEVQSQVKLANNLSYEFTRVSDQIRIREIHLTMLHAMPLNTLNSYGLHALLMTQEREKRIAHNLSTTRAELLRSIDEKHNFINHYKAL